MSDLEDATAELETKTGVRRGFIDGLVKEDDWSFVIKSHALVESACTSFIVKAIGVPETVDIFARMELSGRSVGKVEFLRKLELLDSKCARFITSLSELRNKLVHDVKNTSFTFEQHLHAMDGNQRSKFIENFGHYYVSSNGGAQQAAVDRNKVLSEPKETIWTGLRYVLVTLSYTSETEFFKRETENLHKYMATLANSKHGIN